MIIDFTVENWLSIKDSQTLSLVAQPPYDNHSNHIIDTPDDKIKLLKSIVIYGANASGKSNLLFALDYVKHLVTNSNKNSVDEKLSVVPFLLDKESRNSPTSFELNFFCQNIRYSYSLSFDNEKIYFESLSSYPKKHKRNVFTRVLVEEEYEYKFGSDLKPQRLYEDISKKTLKNVLFLSKSVNDNSQELMPVYKWFSENLSEEDSINDVAKKVHSDEAYKSNLIQFLTQQDINIIDLDITEKNIAEEIFNNKNIPAEIKERIIEENKNNFLYKIKTVYKDSDGDVVPFDFRLESRGTHKLFSLSSLIEKTLKAKVFFVDELSADLHPLLVRNFIETFQRSSDNQLICVTHDTHLINQDILRKDQIYFVEKDINKSSQLYSLLDFNVRNDRENWESRYLSGRYGATPALFEL